MAIPAAKSGFSLEDLTKMGPDEITRKRKLAEALLAESQGIRNIRHPLEGMAQMAQALIGNLKESRLDRAEREGKEGANSLFSAGMGMGEFPPAPGGGGAPASATGAPVNPNVADGSKGNESYPAAAASQQAAGGDIEAYIRQAAQARGIDPDVAVRVARSEGGLSDPYRQADGMLKYGREESYGPFQLHMRMGGVGTRALAEGIDPRKDWKGGIDYALNEAAKKGWGQWFGAAKAGIGSRTGLERAQAIAVQRAQEQAAQGGAQVASLDPSIGMPPAANAMLPPAAGAPGQEAIAKALLGTPADALASDLIAKQAANPGAPVISTDTAAFQPPAALPTPAAPNVVPPGTPPAAQVPIPAPAAAAPQAPAAGVPPQQVQMAQALTGGQPDIGLTMGAPAIQPGGPDLRTLMGMAGNEFMSPQQQKLIEALTGQRMESEAKKSDPAYQMDLEQKRLQLEALKNPKKDYKFITGKDGAIFRADESGNMEQVYGGKPDTFKVLTPQQEVELGLDPAGTYQQGADNKISKIGGEGTTVNIDQKAEGRFEAKLAEKQAETFDTMSTEGMNAKAELGVISELETLLQGQGGTLSGLAGVAAKYGLGGEGLSDLQATQALINKLVPTQRQPGSGTMSDRDVELFTRSLPSLWNQPGGNEKILKVMRGLATYKQAQGEIADQILMGEISRQEGRKMLRALPNPLEGIKSPTRKALDDAAAGKTIMKNGYKIEPVD